LDQFTSSVVEWQISGIEVQIKESHPEPGLRRQKGSIRSVLVGTCAVYLHQEERTVNIPSDQLAPVTPHTGDQVKVISGDYREQNGILRSVDGSDGVVEMDTGRSIEDDSRIQFFPLHYLCKLSSGSDYDYI